MVSTKVIYAATIIHKVINIFVGISLDPDCLIKACQFDERVTETAVNTQLRIVLLAPQTKETSIISFQITFITNTKKVYNSRDACACTNKPVPLSKQLINGRPIIDVKSTPIDRIFE